MERIFAKMETSNKLFYTVLFIFMVGVGFWTLNFFQSVSKVTRIVQEVRLEEEHDANLQKIVIREDVK